MNYLKENGNIYKVEQIGTAEIKSCIGYEKRLELISETKTEKVYQWQKFNLDKEEYVTDEENIDTAEIEGKTYIPEKGKISIKKEKTEIEKKLIEIETELAKISKESNKLNARGVT